MKTYKITKSIKNIPLNELNEEFEVYGYEVDVENEEQIIMEVTIK